MRALSLAILVISSSPNLWAGSRDPFWKPVSWRAEGVQLVGSFRAPKGKRNLWILLHGLGSNRGEWEEFAKAVAEKGDGVLAFDLRGHGESTHNPAGREPLNFQNWKTAGPGSPWEAMVGDVETAVAFMHKTYGFEENRIGLGGASLGANLALAYGAKNPKLIGVLLLSPGMDYAGIRTEKPFATYGSRPLFLAASPGDEYAFMTVQTLAKQRGDSGLQVAAGPTAEHGVNMFKDPAFTQRVLAWTQTLKR